MILIRQRYFSEIEEQRETYFSMADEGFKDDIASRKKSAKSEKTGGAIGGGLVGATGGLLVGDKILEKTKGKGSIGALASVAGLTATGAVIGHRIGKKSGEKKIKRLERLERGYKNATPEEKEYLRRRLEREIDQEKEDIRNMRTNAAIYYSGRGW